MVVTVGRTDDARGLSADFHKLWAALSISLVGSQITALALPLIAVLILNASALEVGILAAARELPFLLFSLPAGVWVDRFPRRPVLVATDIASAILLLTIPLAVLFGGPSFVQLCIVAFGLGSMNVLSEVAHYAYVPALVGRETLTDYNSKLQVSHSASDAAGPGIGGLLVQLLSAPLAVLLDAVSFVGSALLLISIRRSEPQISTDRSTTIRRSIIDGLKMLVGHRLLRPIVISSAVAALAESGFLALYILFAARELALSPGAIGLIFAAGGVGAIPGAIIADRVARRIGVGPAIIGGWTLSGAAVVIVPFVTGPSAVVLIALGLANGLGQLAFTVANIHQWSLRQTVTPDELAGRVTASHRFIVYGAGAIGAALAGALASVITLRAALLVCGIGMLVAPVVTTFSPVRTLREQPSPSHA